MALNVLSRQAPRDAAFLHEHRLLGNSALHELSVPEKQPLATALNILDHVMEGLYNLQAQADELAAIRQSRV